MTAPLRQSTISDTLPLEDFGERRLRPALRLALQVMVENGLSQREAAEFAGMQGDSLTIALKRPHVQTYVAGLKRAWLDNATGVAWRTVSKLMQEGKSEDVRLKAARTVLEAAGELGGPGGAPSDKAQTVINIVMSKGASADATPASGIIEAPYRDVTPRQDLPLAISNSDKDGA